MAILLCIDCSTTHASVALAKDEELILQKTNFNQIDHAAFIQPAIAELMHETNHKLTDVHAVSVTSGPGSYTGLRVGFASAKGLCYALQIPLITLSTTSVMSRAALSHLEAEGKLKKEFFICPLIDARRMDAFTAMYDHHLTEVLKPCAITLHTDSFTEFLEKGPVFFFGTGNEKWQQISKRPNAHFITVNWTAKDMLPDSFKRFREKTFTPLILSEPEYVKGFYFPQN
jgi:tRNA threonylcarbamoyladenosine biosynthesis protein TsaB